MLVTPPPMRSDWSMLRSPLVASPNAVLEFESLPSVTVQPSATERVRSYSPAAAYVCS